MSGRWLPPPSGSTRCCMNTACPDAGRESKGYVEQPGGRLPGPGFHPGQGFDVQPLRERGQAGVRAPIHAGRSAGLSGALGAWWNRVAGDSADSFFAHAAREKAIEDRDARFVVYGHTHHHEIVPLDVVPGNGRRGAQVYFNTGTWRRVHRLARSSRSGRAFVAYDVMTYLAFFKDDERHGTALRVLVRGAGGRSGLTPWIRDGQLPPHGRSLRL